MTQESTQARSRSNDHDGGLSKREHRSVQTLCAIYVSRLLGLYMVLPVLSPYAHGLAGSTSLLTGLSLGAYGATQAALQIPFGYLSDRIGRRRAIHIGLVLFAVGSFAAAFARDAWLLVLARALQGSGAISSVVLALVADHTREQVRTRAMAQVGIWIGASFAIAIIVGPTVAGLLGVPALFLLMALGALGGMLGIAFAVPDPPAISPEERLHAQDLLSIVRQRPLLLIDMGILLLHVVLTVLFVVLPFDLQRIVGPRNTWIVLVPAISIGVAVMAAIGRWADRYQMTEKLFFLGAALLGVSCLVLALAARTATATIVGLYIFVVALAILEPVLSSLLSRFAVGPHRGTATGVYSMAQYGGAFIGGLLGGAFLRRGQDVLFVGLFGLVLVWGILLTQVGHLRPLSRR
jgi:MFS family permease